MSINCYRVVVSKADGDSIRHPLGEGLRKAPNREALCLDGVVTDVYAVRDCRNEKDAQDFIADMGSYYRATDSSRGTRHTLRLIAPSPSQAEWTSLALWPPPRL
jgi:hypothetical protein